MSNSVNNLAISCGMYAFAEELQNAWAGILKHLHHHLPTPYDKEFDIHFDDNTKILSDPKLFMGHTCGYPYISKWHLTHEVVCVPEFAIKGCAEEKYSSWIVTRSNSNKSDLSEFSDTIAVINNTDSNSGMNVFRYEISKYANAKPFFKEVIVSNSHLTSMELIIKGKADIAAIDTATYHFAIEQGVINPKDLKIIAQSSYTTGLPFIVSKELDVDRNTIVDGLNICLENLSPKDKSILNIPRFLTICHEDYIFTKELEMKAQEVGYPVLK